MSLIKLGYIKSGDVVTINKQNFNVLGTVNLYAEGKQYMWKEVGKSWDDFPKWLVDKGALEPTEERNVHEVFEIDRLSPNIFSLEASLGQFPKCLKQMNGIEVGLIGIYANIDGIREHIVKFFNETESGKMSNRIFRTNIDNFKAELVKKGSR